MPTTGRAAWSINNGKFSVIIDDADKMPSQLITPAIAGGFLAIKHSFAYHTLCGVNYIDPTNWQEAERVVYVMAMMNPCTYYETLETQGVTNAEQAWKKRALLPCHYEACVQKK